MTHRLRFITVFLLVLTLLVTLLPVQVSMAATGTSLTDADALAMLQDYRIVRGDQFGNVNVTDRLTRAQAAALFVRSVGMESLIEILKDVVPFQDSKGHWAAGEIAAAERLGLMKGDPTGNFRPEAEITYVEILTVLLRMVEREPSGQWDPDRIVSTAKSLGIVPSGVDPRAPAVRGRIFWALAATLSEVEVDGGRTLLQKHFDIDPPTVKLDKTSIATQDDKVTITGTTTGAARVLVNGQEARLDRETGRFTGDASVAIGSNTVKVEALDWARNGETATVTVDRKGNISRLKITGPATVLVRSNTKLTVEATDSKGNEVDFDTVDVELTGDVATFEVNTQTLKAGTKTGKGTLTLRASSSIRATYNFEVLGPSSSAEKLAFATINSDRAPATEQEVTVQVRVLDEEGDTITSDNGRTVTLSAEGLSGVKITPSQAQTVKGIATFKFEASKVGNVRLEASSSGMETISKELQVLTDTRVVLTTTAKDLKPDGVSKAIIRATLQDRNGRAINNQTNSDIQIELEATGTDGELSDSFLTIPRGKSNSTGNDGEYFVGIASGTVKITGDFYSNHDYSISTLSLPVDSPLAGARLNLSSSPASTSPNGSVTLTLNVVDGSNRKVSAGSYAFGLKVTTSNDDPIVNGLPEGVELTFRNSDYTPVDDGRSTSDPLNDPNSVVGRTNGGQATFTLTYNRSGVVTVTPVLKGGSYEAYNPDIGEGPASASTQLYAPALKVTFSGTASAIVLSVDSDLGSDQPGGAASTSKQLRVYAKVVDSSGAVVPSYGSAITLTRLGNGDEVSNISGMVKRNATNGVAQFTIQTTSTQGFDLYRATAGSLTSNEMTIAVHKTKPDSPYVVAIRGIKEGDLSPVTGYVAPDADYMDIQLEPQPSPAGGEPTHWVKAKVYRKGESREFFTSGAIDLAAPVPIIRIPKKSLTAGEFHYEVVVNNGAGDSPKSPALDDVSKAMNAVTHSSYKLTSATYDAGTKKLTLKGTLVTGGEVDPSKIRFVKGTNQVTLEDATVTSLSSSTLVLTLGDSADGIDPDVFYGSVSIKADTGWFSNKQNTQIAGPQTVTIGMSRVTHANIDPTASRRYLYLYGDGLKTGLNPALFTIHGTNGEVKLTSGDDVTSATEGQVVVRLTSTTLSKIMELEGPLHVTAEVGWINKGTSSSPQRIGAITGTDHAVTLYARITKAAYNKTSNTLTLTGNFPESATLNPGNLTIKRGASGSPWSPGSSNNVVIESDNEVQIVLSDADATAFESQFPAGRTLYLDTLEGWLIDAKGREAQLNAANSVQFSWQ